MFHSFRLKIGLLSVALSGALLLGFGLYALSTLGRVGLDRVDRELRALGAAQMRKSQPEDQWERFNNSLRSIYGEKAAKLFAVKATRTDGGTLYATPDWPAALPAGRLPLSLDASTELAPDGPPGPEGVQRPRPLDEPAPRPPPQRPLQLRGPVYATLGGADGEWRAMTIANREVTLSLAMSLADLRAELRRFRLALLVGVPIGLLVLVAGGWLLGQMALRPVQLIARTVESVTARSLDERIPDTAVDAEFRQLIVPINGMLDRLERSFQQATRFSADAAHELKTPLAVLQARIEPCLQRAADGSPEQREYAEQLDEVQRLKAIVRKLLLLSQADSGRLPLNCERINLAALAQAAAEDVRLLAPERQARLQAPPEAWVRGDALLLNQVLENLVSNAVKFGDRGGRIDLELEIRGGRAVLAVSNTGTPIAPQDQEKLFERFHRGDKSRSREIEGTGLGLSLAREIARAHGGDLALRQSGEQQTTFALELPLAG